jgi:hypothetical protein
MLLMDSRSLATSFASRIPPGSGSFAGIWDVIAHRIEASALNPSGETTSAGLLFLSGRSVNANAAEPTDSLG